MPTLLRRIAGLLARVLANFSKHKGLLLAGGIAYNALISLVPLAAVLLVALSQLFDPGQLVAILRSELAMVIPGQAEGVVAEVERFLAQRQVIGGVGLLVLIFFASLAFRMLGDALAVIFEHRRLPVRRRFWIAALLPYLHIALLGVALVVLTAFVTLIDALPGAGGHRIGLTESALLGGILYVSGVIGQALLFTLIYRLMPAIAVHTRRALVGGICAAAMWEVVRRVLTWYFTSISIVNVIYGSLTTVVIVLLTFEIAAVIILLGAQIIAELQHSADAGLPWYEAAPDENEVSRSGAALTVSGDASPALT
jgi:membrane protein